MISTNTVYQYTLSTAWDISTATYASKSKGISAQESNAYGVTFSADGTKMYVMGISSDTVFQYTLSTAWNVSTATYASKSKSVSAQENSPRGLEFSADGTKMYMIGTTNNTVYQYTLSTDWDVSTATYASKSKSVLTQDNYSQDVTFSADGTKMYIIGTQNDTIYQYTLSTAWNVSTATYASKSKDTNSQDSTPSGLHVSSDGTKAYVMGSANNTVFQYDLTYTETWKTTDLEDSDVIEIRLNESELSGDILLSTTTVSFAADADTTLYTVPTGKRCILSHAVIVAAADAGATTTISIGANGAETDFIPANTLSNLDAQYDSVILKPIPNLVPLKNKSYAAATVIEAQIASQSGAADNTVYLFGITY